MYRMLRDVAVGAAAGAGAGAGRAMDAATTWFLQRQVTARRLADVFGAEVTDEEAARLAGLLHRGLKTAYGVTAALLVRAGTRPLRAGLAVGTAAFLVVDEGMSALGVVPRAPAYPLESHLRGPVGHLTFGIVMGGTLALARRLGAVGSV